MTDNLAVDDLSVNMSEMAQYTMEAELYLKQLANKTRLMVLCFLMAMHLDGAVPGLLIMMLLIKKVIPLIHI